MYTSFRRVCGLLPEMPEKWFTSMNLVISSLLATCDSFPFGPSHSDIMTGLPTGTGLCIFVRVWNIEIQGGLGV